MIRTAGLGIKLDFDEEIDPRFPEALVRGGLGFVMKRMICINKRASDCSECLIKNSCLYSRMYSDAGKTVNKLQVSPYAVQCTVNGQASVTIKLILFEPLIEYYGHLIAVLSRLGQEGIGRSRKKYTVLEVWDIFVSDRIFNHSDITDFKPSVNELNSSPFCASSDKEELLITFISPLRLEKDGKLTDSPDFRDIIKSCAMRFLNIERAFSDGKADFSVFVKDYLKNSESVLCEPVSLKWQHKDRYSSRQKRRIFTGGVTGSVRCSGNIRPYLWLLEFGELCGIGKNTTFGCGKYTISKGN